MARHPEATVCCVAVSAQERSRQRLAAETHLGPLPVASSDLSVCLVYPNTYRVGMANLGYHSIYDILVRAGVAVERAFLCLLYTSDAADE